MRPADTSVEAWRVFIDLQRRATPEEKLRRTFELSEMIERASREGLRQQYPDAGEGEIRLRATRLKLGAELFKRVYGDCLDDDE